MTGVMDYIIKIAGCLTALGVIGTMVFKAIKSSNKELKSMIEDLSKNIKSMDYNQCKRYLIDFMADIKQRIPKTETQIKQAKDIYTHYIKDLEGNSYVSDEWEDLKSKGLI